MSFFQSIILLLPALIPSWNFFDIITASPRIQFTLLNPEKEALTDWQEFRPRPKNVSFLQTLKHMLWNPTWNESLFMVSCAERIMDNYTEHSENEILNRIENKIDSRSASYLQFRIYVIQRENKEIIKHVVFTSRFKNIKKEEQL